MSHALATVEQVQREITDLPRMADFALWAYAALGEQGSAFLDAYSSNRADAATEPLEGEPIAEPLQKVAETAWQAGGNWSGTASELLAELAARAGEPATKRLHWPASARALSGRLRRLAPALRAIGIEVLFDQRAHGGRRLLTLVKSAANDRHHRHHRHAESENCAEGDANAGQGDANEDRADGFASPTGQHAESAGDAGDGGDARSRGFSGAGQADDDADPLAERCRECDNAGGWLGQPGAWRCRACGARRMCWHCLGYQPPEHVPAIAEDVEGRGCCARHAATGEAAAADDGDGGAGG